MQEKQGIPGNTPLISAVKLGKFLGIDQLYIKFEGSNPTGTQKDRSASLQVRTAMEEGFDTIVAASCGNYGASIAYYAHLNGLKALIYVPKGSHSPRLLEIKDKHGAKLVQVEGLYEDSVERSKMDAVRNRWFDGNAGAHPLVGLEAFSSISSEIYDSIGEIPGYVAVPVGNGTTLAGIHYGFSRLKEIRGLAKRPRMIAASTDGGNPIVESFKNHRKKITDFPREKIKETEINEPLVNFHSYDGELALSALIESDGYAEYVTDEDLYRYRDAIKKYEKIEVIPAAAASVASIDYITKREKTSGIKVAVVTG
jgi:threonine synthase